MNRGQVRSVEHGACEDVYVVETGMYDTTEYGCVYIVDAERPAIVETGIGSHYQSILDALGEVGLEPADIEVIAVTHVHLDHAGGAGLLASECENATVYAHEIGAPHLVEPGALVEGTKEAVGEQWKYYVDPEPVPNDRITAIEDGDVVDLGDRELHAHHAPGHAPHQVVFHVPSLDAVFTGDAAGIWIASWNEVHHTSPPPQFDLDQAVEDIGMIADLEPRTLLYTHFGPAENTDTVLDSYELTLAQWVRDVDEAYAEMGDQEAVIGHFIDRTDTDEIWGSEKSAGETRLNVRGALTYLERIRGED